MSGGSDLKEGMRSVNEFDSAALFQAVVRCLQAILPDREIKTSVGAGMSARVSACAETAQIVKVRRNASFPKGSDFG
jgi:hypothetical protein